MSNKHGFLDNLLKKRLIIPIAAVFLAFVIIGFWAASQLDSPLTGRIFPQKLAETQKNYLLVQVDDLERRSPGVIAIWVAFIDRSDSTHLVFMPLFPNSDLKVNTRIARTLRMTREGLVTDRTIRKIENRYNIRTDGFVVMDNTGITSISRNLFDESLTPVAGTPQDAEEISRILTVGKDRFTAFCTGIQQQGGGNFINKIDWGELLPAHFATSLSFEELTLELESLKPAGLIQTCEVIVD